MKSKIKEFFGYFTAALSLVLGFMFLVSRSRNNKLEGRLAQSDLENKDLPLKLDQARNEERIAEIKRDLKEIDKPVEVTDLSPKEVEEYWK
jgi:hypothetical protein